MSQPVAVIDLGTNTARLLIGTVENGTTINQQLLERKIIRLGGGFTKQGLSREAEIRALETLHKFALEINRFNVKKVRAVATSAVRDAANGKQFCDRVLNETGIMLEVIDGVKESHFMLHGVLSGLNDTSSDYLVFDIGGGSTEYVLAKQKTLTYSMSLPLGVVRLSEGNANPNIVKGKIDRELVRLENSLRKEQLIDELDGATLVGTAGTATTLAAIHMKMSDYDYRKVNNYTITLRDIEEIYEELLPMSPTERLKVKGIEPGREDLIVTGILITLRTMTLFGFDKLKISDYGLLEGLLLCSYDSSLML
jgi:exopolyphosphatase/guanosine-5'-triphosphate,3'-diphosphate pyrophosphatase